MGKMKEELKKWMRSNTTVYDHQSGWEGISIWKIEHLIDIFFDQPERLNPETLPKERCDSLTSTEMQRGESEEVFPRKSTIKYSFCVTKVTEMTGPVRSAYFMLSSTELQPDFDALTGSGFLSQWNYWYMGSSKTVAKQQEHLKAA